MGDVGYFTLNAFSLSGCVGIVQLPLGLGNVFHGGCSWYGFMAFLSFIDVLLCDETSPWELKGVLLTIFFG